MFACVALTAVTIVQKLLNLLSSVLGARGETVCRLLGSFVKYATIIGMVYYCLMLVGVDLSLIHISRSCWQRLFARHGGPRSHGCRSYEGGVCELAAFSGARRPRRRCV